MTTESATAASSLRQRGSNHVGMRQYNERVVLQALRLHGSLPKAELARQTGLTAQTIGVITARLEEDQLLRREAPGKPVCLIGTSNGSLSATSVAALLVEQGPECIVLTSSVSAKPQSSIIARFAHVFTDADLTKIKVPVLIVHHKNDSCKYTPYEPMPGYVKAFVNSPKVDFITVDGGQDHSDSCNRGHHQFLGIEREITAQISDWIKDLR